MVAMRDNDAAGDNKKPERTPMGEYIVPLGGKPLTSLGDCNPAPSDYSPKVDLTKPAAPHYSVAGPYKRSKADHDVSPADHDTTPNMTWRDKKVSLKGKGKMCPYDVREGAHVNDSVGPLKYRVDYRRTGTSGPKFSMAARHTAHVHNGPPNKLVQPVDTHGVDTPGPNFCPGDSSYWNRGHEQSFGSSRKERPPEGPGPAEYDISTRDRGLAYSFARRLPPSHLWKNSINTVSPGPGSYNLGTTIGRAQAKSISGRAAELSKEEAPAPNLYSVPDSFNIERYAATLNYGWCDPEEPPHPSPTTYTITDVSLKKAAAYSMSSRTRPCFPELLNYPLLAQQQTTFPGPGSYESRSTLTDKSKKFSMGTRARSAKNEVPGPNKYNINTDDKRHFAAAPGFSMGMRINPIDKRVSPGPAAYYPRPESCNNGHIMTKRPKMPKKFITPAPNAYGLSQGQTAKGTSQGPKATLKSRASPYVFSGLQTSKVLRA